MGIDIQPIIKIKFAKWCLQVIKKFMFIFVKIVFPDIDSSKHSIIIPQASYSPWLLDENFKEVLGKTKNFTKLDEYRMYELWRMVEQIKKIDGDIIQIGTWRGGSGCLLAKKAQLEKISCTVYLCDTFEGVVKAGEKDEFYKGGEHADTSKELVEKLTKELSLDNIKILKGIFPDETSYLITDCNFSFCHIDVDSYASAKDILDWIWDKMTIHGIIVFDDYGDFVAGGITDLVNEEAKKHDRIMIHNLNGHAIMIKIK